MVRAVHYVNRLIENRVGYRILVDSSIDVNPIGMVIKSFEEEYIYLVFIRAPTSNLLRVVSDHEFAHILWDFERNKRLSSGQKLEDGFRSIYLKLIYTRPSLFRLFSEGFYLGRDDIGHPYSSVEELFCSFFTLSDLSMDDRKIGSRFLRNFSYINDLFDREFERFVMEFWRLYGMEKLIDELERIRENRWYHIKSLVAKLML